VCSIIIITFYLIEPSHIVIQPGQGIHLPAGSNSLVLYCVAYGVQDG